MMIGRSDSQHNAEFFHGASTSTGRLAAGCGSHLGPAVADRTQRPDTRPLSTRIIRSHLLHPRSRPHTEKRRSTEQKNTVTMGVTATQDSTSEWRELGAQVSDAEPGHFLGEYNPCSSTARRSARVSAERRAPSRPFVRSWRTSPIGSHLDRNILGFAIRTLPTRLFGRVFDLIY